MPACTRSAIAMLTDFFAECVPPFTHDVCVRVVRLALPPVLREPRDVKPTPPSEPACRPSCRTSVLFLADM